MAKKKPTNQMDFPALEREHSALTSVVQRFCEAIVQQLGKLLTDEGIVLAVPIQYRVKQWTSLVEKFERVHLQVDSIKEVQDLAGLRIILLFKRDVETVCSLISKNFKIVNQYDTQERLKDDQFGYSSRHFVLELPDGWLAVPTLADMGGLVAEIQVRTLAQHAWAEISHKLQYKQETNVPPVVRRAIYRASALLEIIDLEFERVLNDRNEYRADIQEMAQVRVIEENEPLNVDLLEKILDSILPLKNKVARENYDELLNKDLFAFDITTSADLANLIEKHKDVMLEEDAQMVQLKLKELKEFNRITGTDAPRVTENGVFYTHVGLVRSALEAEFGQKYNAFQARWHR
jgi:ppGpp synthetase/RelA/SpoT-type nucleotidyltranferase